MTPCKVVTYYTKSIKHKISDVITCRRHLIRSPGAINVVENTPATTPASNNCGQLQKSQRQEVVKFRRKKTKIFRLQTAVNSSAVIVSCSIATAYCRPVLHITKTTNMPSLQVLTVYERCLNGSAACLLYDITVCNYS